MPAPIKALVVEGENICSAEFCLENGNVTEGVWDIRLHCIYINFLNRNPKTICSVQSNVVQCYMKKQGRLISEAVPLAVFDLGLDRHEKYFDNSQSDIWFELSVNMGQITVSLCDFLTGNPLEEPVKFKALLTDCLSKNRKVKP